MHLSTVTLARLTVIDGTEYDQLRHEIQRLRGEQQRLSDEQETFRREVQFDPRTEQTLKTPNS